MNFLTLSDLQCFCAYLYCVPRREAPWNCNQGCPLDFKCGEPSSGETGNEKRKELGLETGNRLNPFSSYDAGSDNLTMMMRMVHVIDFKIGVVILQILAWDSKSRDCAAMKPLSIQPSHWFSGSPLPLLLYQHTHVDISECVCAFMFLYIYTFLMAF